MSPDRRTLRELGWQMHVDTFMHGEAPRLAGEGNYDWGWHICV